MEFVIWSCSIEVYVFHHCLLSESISEDWVDLKIKQGSWELHIWMISHLEISKWMCKFDLSDINI